MRYLLPAIFVACVVAVALGFGGEAMAGPDEAWAALQRGGMVVIMRHASAPGPEQGHEGDPSGFMLEDCSTQRNLDAYGRSQATALGAEMRAHHVVFTRVMSSPWCRAKDTATLMNLGPPVEINKFLFNVGDIAAQRANKGKGMPPRMIAIRRIHGMIRNWEGPGNLMLVSHGRTVAAVVYGPRSLSPEQAEPIVLEPSEDSQTGFREIGTLPPPGGSHN